MTTKPADTVIFLHIPKAAGTTLLQIINKNYAPAERHAFGANARASMEAFKALPEATKRQYKFVGGHMGFGLHQYMPQATTYITILRDPVERAISYYHHVLSNPPHYLHQWVQEEQIDFEQFTGSRITPELDNSQTRLLASEDAMWSVPYGECTPEMLAMAQRNLQQYFAVVGVADQFDETLILLKLILGWEHVLYARANVSQGRPSQESISASARANIERDNQYDIALYQFARQLLVAQINQRQPQFKREYDKFLHVDRRRAALENRLRSWERGAAARKQALEKRLRKLWQR